MAATSEHALELAGQYLSGVRVLDRDEDETRSLIRIEGRWRSRRVVIQQAYRADHSARYAYYVLDADNRLVYAYNNHRDKTAIRLKYRDAWRAHWQEEVPHRHSRQGDVTLTRFVTLKACLLELQEIA